MRSSTCCAASATKVFETIATRTARSYLAEMAGWLAIGWLAIGWRLKSRLGGGLRAAAKSACAD
jgi:hypothetical protein